MTPSTRDLFVIARMLCGEVPGGALAAVTPALRGIADYLFALPLEARGTAWDAFLCAPGFDREAVARALAEIDPLGELPGAPAARRFATVADVRRGPADVRWVWDGWLPRARIVGVGGFEGTGKTRFALDLHRRAYQGLRWPDGQDPTFPAGTRSIFLCSDSHHDEFAEILPAFGLPDESVVFPAPPDDPYGLTDLDNPETIAALDEAIAQVRPAFVFVDTLTSATSRDLCDQRSMKPLKAPLADLVQRHQVTIVLLLHLSREGQALGRRIKGITRTLIHLEAPNANEPSRLKLWVEKSYATKPPALGVTMRDGGNDYDFSPPCRPDSDKGGRPPEERGKAKVLILAALRRQNHQIGNHLEETFDGSRQTFWRAVDELVEAGAITVDGGKGAGKQKTLHLAQIDPPIEAF